MATEACGSLGANELYLFVLTWVMSLPRLLATEFFATRSSTVPIRTESYSPCQEATAPDLSLSAFLSIFGTRIHVLFTFHQLGLDKASGRATRASPFYVLKLTT
jgi:hypothetical protein